MGGLKDYEDCYFRRCSKEEIIVLFDIEKLFPNKYKFISLTHSQHIASTNEDDYVVVYDGNMLDSQGAMKVEYTVDFMRKHEDIFLHIATDYFTGDDKTGKPITHYLNGSANHPFVYWDSLYSSKILREFGLPMSTSPDEWIDFNIEAICDDRKSEQEIVIPIINLVPGLVKDIVYYSDGLPIPYSEEGDIYRAVNRFVKSYIFPSHKP